MERSPNLAKRIVGQVQGGVEANQSGLVVYLVGGQRIRVEIARFDWCNPSYWLHGQGILLSTVPNRLI